MRVGQLAQVTQKKDKQARRYYLRLMVMDETGVLSAVTSILRDQQISVESMLQKGQSDDKPVALVLTTHPTAPDQIKAAVPACHQLALSLVRCWPCRLWMRRNPRRDEDSFNGAWQCE